MRCTPFFHDAIKCGLNGSMFSVHNHPILAGQWVRDTKVEHDISDELKETIARMCERHSGEWATSKKMKLVLPEPENDMEMFIHECDYLSSRNNIDMPIPEYLNDVLADKPVEFDENYTLTFGKYNGLRLIDVYKKKPDYISWMEENIHRREVLAQIKAMKEYLKTQEQDDDI
jgi:uncharacterized protein (DUF3820 family)